MLLAKTTAAHERHRVYSPAQLLAFSSRLLPGGATAASGMAERPLPTDIVASIAAQFWSARAAQEQVVAVTIAFPGHDANGSVHTLRLTTDKTVGAVRRLLSELDLGRIGHSQDRRYGILADPDRFVPEGHALTHERQVLIDDQDLGELRTSPSVSPDVPIPIELRPRVSATKYGRCPKLWPFNSTAAVSSAAVAAAAMRWLLLHLL